MSEKQAMGPNNRSRSGAPAFRYKAAASANPTRREIDIVHFIFAALAIGAEFDAIADFLNASLRANNTHTRD